MNMGRQLVTFGSILISDSKSGLEQLKSYSESYTGYWHCVVIETSLLLVAWKSHRVGHILKMHQMDSKADD